MPWLRLADEASSIAVDEASSIAEDSDTEASAVMARLQKLDEACVLFRG